MHRILFLLLFPAMVYGQTAQETVERKLKSTTSQFKELNETDVVVATPYTKSYAGIAGSPFWSSDVWCSADVKYKGIMYQITELKYDCANDLMVIPKYTNDGVQLLNLIPSIYPEITINKKVKSNQNGKIASETTIYKEHFIYYPATKDENNDGVSSGYYHYVIEKTFSLLCKYTSSVVERNGQKIFDEEVKYYLQKDGKLLKIHRAEIFLNAFPLWKDKINAFIEDNKINTLVSLDSGNIEKLIEFINTLSPQ